MVLKGFKMEDGTKNGFSESLLDEDYMYFIRTDSGMTEGYIYINGKHYGLVPKELNCGEF